MTIYDDEQQRLLATLRQAGEEPDQALLDAIKASGRAVVPALIAVATDQTLLKPEDDGPESWAPLHAGWLLGEMEAVEPLLPLFAQVDDGEWLEEILTAAFGRFGRPALAPLRALLRDRGRDAWTRGRATDALQELARCHPNLRGEVVAALTAHLDAAEAEPEEETLNAFVITALLDLEAREALPAMRRAFAQDRVDQRIVGPDSLTFGDSSPSLELPIQLQLDREAGLKLWLRCTACRYERPHQVPTVYCDRTTVDQRARGEETPYSEYVIPQRITCPKRGAVDQYELTSDAMLALTAEIMASMPELAGLRRAPADGEVR